MKPFEITRVFDAPRERVWQAWTEAERLKKWWGPKGFKVAHCKVDLRPAVALNAVARGPSDEAAAMLKGMDHGWAQTVDRLGAHLRK